MEVIGGNLITKIADKQFEIIGVKKKFSDIPDGGDVLIGKKKVPWYEVYRFTEEQEEEWRKWAWEELRKSYPEKEADEWLVFTELAYGFVRELKKKGELF